MLTGTLNLTPLQQSPNATACEGKNRHGSQDLGIQGFAAPAGLMVLSLALRHGALPSGGIDQPGEDVVLGGDALGCVCSFLVVWGFSSHQSCPVYLLLQQGCLHSPVLKPILGLSLGGWT